MIRPTINEIDTWSYLDGSLDVHRILGRVKGGYRCDGSPELGYTEDRPDPLCRSCAYRWAQEAGFVGPYTLPVTFQPGLPPVGEEVLVKRDDEGPMIAQYAYGRAYFEPLQPRTRPCAWCGGETLRDTIAGGPE